MSLEEIIQTRRSVRAFLDTPVDENLLRDILKIASYAPSGTNIQPWKVYVVSGNKRDEIVRAVSNEVDQAFRQPENAVNHQPPFEYYPQEWISPYIDRRRQNGWALYGLLGIQKGDKEKMHQQHLRNYCFFDAPVGLFFTTHRVMGHGAKMDIAMLMQNIMLTAHDKGLGTCAQAAWNAYHDMVLPLLGANQDEILIAAMALGYPDANAVVNTMKPVREDVEQFTVFLS